MTLKHNLLNSFYSNINNDIAEDDVVVAVTCDNDSDSIVICNTINEYNSETTASVDVVATNDDD